MVFRKNTSNASFILHSVLWEINAFFLVHISLLYFKGKNRDLVMTMLITVKVILIILYLQAYKLAFYSFMDAGRGQDSWVRDTKNLLLMAH